MDSDIYRKDGNTESRVILFFKTFKCTGYIETYAFIFTGFRGKRGRKGILSLGIFCSYFFLNFVLLSNFPLLASYYQCLMFHSHQESFDAILVTSLIITSAKSIKYNNFES